MSKRPPIDAAAARRAYEERKNILAHMRDTRGLKVNDEVGVMVAYDMQASTYVNLTTTPGVIAERHAQSATKLAGLFDSLGVTSLLDAGTGEATLLCSILRRVHAPPGRVYGFDISLSRLLVARHWARQQGISNLGLFVGSLLEIPVRNDAFDTVFTNHAIEPNRGRERDIIRELYRVCRRYLILREPSYELGNEKTRARIDMHKYVTDIPGAVADLGYDVVEHGLFEADINTENQSALTIIRKRDSDVTNVADYECPYASPISKSPLTFTGEAYYSVDDALVFPVISGVPCLLPDNGIFSSRYLELRG